MYCVASGRSYPCFENIMTVITCSLASQSNVRSWTESQWKLIAEDKIINHLLRFPKSIPWDDNLAEPCIRPPKDCWDWNNKTLPGSIFFSPSLFTQAVVCDRNCCRSQVPRKLTIFFLSLQTSASIYPPIHWHTALWMHSPV